jgi:phosphoribosylformylglycinamidine synthase
VKKAKAMVLYGDGINCDAETAYALQIAGIEPVRQHTTQLLEDPSRLFDYQMLVIPGGFSFGDEIASGKVLAIKLKQKMQETLNKFVDRGSFVLGICNGFQVLVQMGILPASSESDRNRVSLTRNAGGKFVNCWVDLNVSRETKSPFFTGLEKIQLPIRHGEGRLFVDEHDTKTVSMVKKQAELRYDTNINGSYDQIAGLSNDAGNVFGLMPHPEAFVRWSQHPAWTRFNASTSCGGEINSGTSDATRSAAEDLLDRESFGLGVADGLAIFQNAAQALNS